MTRERGPAPLLPDDAERALDEFVKWYPDAGVAAGLLTRIRSAAALSSPETTPAGVLDALWQCGVESGMDTDGDAGPGALVAGMGEAGFAAAMVKEVRRLRLAYDECLSEPAGVLDEAWAAAERVVREYDKTHLTHDVAYEDVAEAIDRLRLALPRSGRAAGMTDLDSDDFRDRHERAWREHIIGGPTDHDCDDLCSAAVIDRLVGKTPINEYPLRAAALGRSGSGGGRG